MQVLVTGGAGYIGSHTCVELIAAGHQVVIVDNFCNSSPEVLNRLKLLTGVDIPFYQTDIGDSEGMHAIFAQHNIDAVIHFAGLKAVGESVTMPLAYYSNNVSGTLAMLQVMTECNVFNIVFSSSATVYGDPLKLPIDEQEPLKSTNPYGWTKQMIEQVLQDMANADPRWKVILLRYFNPVGAHSSGEIGESPRGAPNNLLPFVTQVAVGRREKLSVFGDDWDTPDGTGVRDYIHVVDLAQGHLAALDKITAIEGSKIYNLGTGNGYSVLELVRALEQASGRKVPYEVVGRRSGDIATCYADPSAARRDLGWQAQLGLEQMVADAWRWQSQYPHGYDQ